MAFLHPRYFPFCPKIGFGGVGVSNRTRYQGPFSLEQAMALYWMVGSITISGTQKGPEDFKYSFTGTGQPKMSDTLCPAYLPDSNFPNLLQWGWVQEIQSPPSTVFENPIVFSTASDIFADGRNVIYSGNSYYVAFAIRLGAEEGASIISNSQTFNTTKTLQITDETSVPITFFTVDNIDDPLYTSTIDSLTCTLRDPS
jgi:hypothetical protein